jgi:hypothetical protein
MTLTTYTFEMLLYMLLYDRLPEKGFVYKLIRWRVTLL